MECHHPPPLFLLFQLLVLVLLLIINPTNQQFVPVISNTDLSVLHEIKNALTDLPSSSSPFFSSWDFNSRDPCSTFTGIVCSVINNPAERRITSLTLGTGYSDSRGLAGYLPNSVSNLTELTQLILFPGIVTGPIPPQLGLLQNLRVISLTNNRLTGSIPVSVSSLANLHTLDLSYNLLTGSIPPGLKTGLPRLKVLILSSNRLTGHLPDLPAQLLHLDLKRNRISGTLPVQMPLTLRYLSLSVNKMWGPLNGCLDSLSELVYLDLSMNKFGGPIPSSLFRATTHLSSLFLQRNNFSGRVPTLSPAPFYGPGSVVDLSHNALTGELSTVLVGAESVFVNNNRLMGRVPEEYITRVNSGSIRTLYLQHNYISGLPEPGPVMPPDTASVCLTYNCMEPPAWVMACPASAGGQISRPADQCAAFYNGNSSTG